MDKHNLGVKEPSAPPSNELPAVSIYEFNNKTDVSVWENFTIRPKRPMKELLHRMFKQGINRNITVVAEKRHFSCHLLVLRAISRYFQEFEFSHVVHLPEEKVTAKAFICIYTWVFTGNTSLNGNIIIELFRAAEFLGIEELLKLCWACFENQTNCEAQAVLLLEQTSTSTIFTKNILFARICKYFLLYVASKDFQELDEDDVCNLLTRNSIGVNTEMEVLMSGLVWLSYNWTKRQNSLNRILECVDFKQMPFIFLASIRKRRDSFIFEYIAESNVIDEIIQETMSTESKVTIPKNLKRFWIYDPICKYHHSLDCQTSVYLTYDNFLDYLEQLQMCDSNHWSGIKDNTSLNINCCPDNESAFEDPLQ